MKTKAEYIVFLAGVCFNVHYFYEFSAKDRFRGSSIGLNFAIKLSHKK